MKTSHDRSERTLNKAVKIVLQMDLYGQHHRVALAPGNRKEKWAGRKRTSAIEAQLRDTSEGPNMAPFW
eukprot:scaffold220077_cov15-Tisochrysis_lutea.AAC.1